MKFICAVLSAALMALAAPALATVVQYEVRGVKSNDKLNVRAAPAHTARIVGRIPHNGREIEIIGKGRGQWVRIAYGRTQGFVNRTFLKVSPRKAARAAAPALAPVVAPAPATPEPAAPSMAVEPKALETPAAPAIGTAPVVPAAMAPAPAPAPAAPPAAKLDAPVKPETSLPGSKQDGDDTPALMKPPADMLEAPSAGTNPAITP
jgi:uncharacterized protein YgiM (DUF1202 family)